LKGIKENMDSLQKQSAAYEVTIPRRDKDPLKLTLEIGRSINIIGANGAGKNRLGVYLEKAFSVVHRIPAHKSLLLNDKVSLITLERAEKTLFEGHADQPRNKDHFRWGSKPATHLLSDFDALLQTLFAGHNRIASQHLQQQKQTPNIEVPVTKLETLKSIWDKLLPHRSMQINEASIEVLSQSSSNSTSYAASEMSDGERAIFYFLGQCLVAPTNSALIIDEPEGHVHKAILGPLWDAIEATRLDCGFIFITQDLDFATSHTASAKYFVRTFDYNQTQWDIEELPENTGLPERVVAEIAGSRRPILFVEGEHGSMDLTIYRHCFGGFTIMPIGSCEAVIHSVVSYANSEALHWLEAYGIVDADERETTEIEYLRDRNVHALPVGEVENLLLLPSVFLALAVAFSCADPRAQLVALTNAVMKAARSNLDLVSTRYVSRQLDRRLKRVTLKAKDLAGLQTEYSTELASIEPTQLFNDFRVKLETGINDVDLPVVLKLYKNKGLLAIAATLLGLKDQKQLLEKVGRLVGAESGKRVRDELVKVLPQVGA
jgi:hypothetical protein